MQAEEYERLFRYESSYWWFVARRRLALNLLERFLPSGGKVLDMGCGTGGFLSELPEKYTGVGFDLSPVALRMCRKRSLVRLAASDAQRLGARSEMFDAVVALDVIEHLDRDHSALAEAFRVLRPGGALIASVPAFQSLWSPHDVALMHRRRYRLGQFRANVARAGFDVRLASYAVFVLFPAVVAVRFLQKLVVGRPGASLPPVPPWLNGLLIRLQALEYKLLARARLPWGSSVVVVARKPM